MHNFTADRWNLHQSVVGAFGLAGLTVAQEVVADDVAIRFRGDAMTSKERSQRLGIISLL